MGTRITDSMVARGVLADLNDVSNRLRTTQGKLSSGREINRPSDDPYGTSRALGLRSDVSGTQQYQRSASEAVSWQNITDAALSNMTDALHRARELTLKGATDSSGQDARNAAAAEIDQLIEGIKGEANASFGGRYVFSGTQTGTKPYSVAGVDTYAGNGALIAREIGPGVAVQVNVIGQTLLGDGQGANDGLLIDNLRDIAQHLRGGTTADADALRSTDLQALDANLTRLVQARATVGATTNRLESASSRLAQVEEAATKLLSDVEFADMAKTMIDYTIQSSSYKAALQAGANITQQSLLDWLR